MKMNLLFSLTFFFVFFSFGLNAQSITLEWTNFIGGPSFEDGTSMALDANGNTYTIGSFSDSVDFDPGLGVYMLYSPNIYDMFVQKTDPNGNMIWTYMIVTDARSNAGDIVIDDAGYIYIMGNFQGTADVDPGPGTLNFTAAGGSGFDAFFQKIDTNANLIWAKHLSGPGSDYAIGILVENDHLYAVGSFNDTIDLDPGAGSHIEFSPGFQSDLFIQKWDTSGNYVWAKVMQGPDNKVINSISIDPSGNVYTCGGFKDTVDFDPGPGVYNLVGQAQYDAFIQKLDANGNFIWTKQFTGPNQIRAYFIAADGAGNIYVTGQYQDSVDFDPGPSLLMQTAVGYYDMYIEKLDSNGNLIWFQSYGDIGNDLGSSIIIEENGDLYVQGNFYGPVDFDPGMGVYTLNSFNGQTMFLTKLDSSGNLLFATALGGAVYQASKHSFAIDATDNIYLSSVYAGITTDFDPGPGVYNPPGIAGMNDYALTKIKQRGIIGLVYEDFNQNCTQSNNENSLIGRHVVINPGSIISTTNNRGMWILDSLPAGNYTVTIDTSGPWDATCTATKSFSVNPTDKITTSPSLALISTTACPVPDVSISTSILRPGFSQQMVYVQVCNDFTGAKAISNTDLIVDLHPLLTILSASNSFNNLGNNQYQFSLDTLNPGECQNIWLDCHLDSAATLGQTICLKGELVPIDNCILDSIPQQFQSFSSCNSAYDNSHLEIEANCNGANIEFKIQNTGTGNMTCWHPVRLYIDTTYILLDSVQLLSGDSTIFSYSNNGKTWRMEVPQHPLHPGNSNPSVTLERCGNTANWTADLFNHFAQDDADPYLDITCRTVSGSYDPNDKIGQPFGLGPLHEIHPNQDLEYRIRFQNTGTDTAFTVVIQDTLAAELDLFSVTSGVSSHDYNFRIYGPRVLEWTFNNIMLPDSNTNEAASKGFINFKVKQTPNLSPGTVIYNTAAIYFDFNLPIFTNTSWHTILNPSLLVVPIDNIKSSASNIQVYPNPSTGTVYIERATNEEVTISILDVWGRILNQTKSISRANKLDLNAYPNGIYFILINNENEYKTFKIIKQ